MKQEIQVKLILFLLQILQYQKKLIAQAAGIQLVPASELQEKFKQNSLDSDETEEDSDQAEDDGEDYGDSEESDQEEDVLEENLNRKCKNNLNALFIVTMKRFNACLLLHTYIQLLSLQVLATPILKV